MIFNRPIVFSNGRNDVDSPVDDLRSPLELRTLLWLAVKALE